MNLLSCLGTANNAPWRKELLSQLTTCCSQMKPLFSKKEKEVYHPGDPRRKVFEDTLRRMGQNLEEFEGKTIEVDTGVGKVSFLFKNRLKTLRRTFS